MSDQDTLPRKEKKFFFDNIHFDEPEEEEIIEEEPPPPTFSEEELANARKESFELGKRDGLTQAHNSFEKQTEVLLEVIARDIQTLFQEEDARARLYEAEAVRLSDAIFKKLFPVLNERHGLDEIHNVIEKIITDQPEAPEIQLFVAPDFVDKISQHVAENEHISNLPGTISVKADPRLEAGDCRLSWKEGGGLRDISRLSSQIAKEIELLLADAPVNKDNGSGEAYASEDIQSSVTDHEDTDQDNTTRQQTDGDE